MAIRIGLNHRTEYHYDRPVELGPQIIRLRPAPHCRTPIVSYSLNIDPEDHFLNWQQDPQSNYLARLLVNEPTRAFCLEVDLVAELAPINPFDFFLDTHAETYPFEYSSKMRRELRPYFQKQRMQPLFQAFLESIDTSEQETIKFLQMVNEKIHSHLRYSLRMDPGIYTPERTLKLGEGSCRDFAWLLVHVLRRLGMAARFVSGYSIQLAEDEKPVDPNAPTGVSEDVCDLHAWCEVYLPGAGWVGMDATSGLFCGEGHIPLAASATAEGASPIEGGVSPSKAEFNVDMSVTRLHEDPRVTKPYTDGQWKAVLELGDEIDRRLQAGDVRLSMGGEPTFVSATDLEGEEWNTGAVGPTKKPLSEKLIHRLRARFGPHGLVHYGQGKWYPGEPLPRWAIGLYWRKDKVPVWERDDLIAREDAESNNTHEDAKALAEELTRQLDVNPAYINPAYEDPVRFALRERELPINVDPLDNRLEDPQEREQLLKVFERGLNTPVGYVLPLERAYDHDGPAWHSGLWMLRGSRMYLLPGDSPIGLRLPLESLPWAKKEEIPVMMPPDPSARYNNLPGRRSIIVRQQPTDKPRLEEPETAHADRFYDLHQNRPPEAGQSAHWVIRTALCIECRDGRICVFMPPSSKIEDYLDLLTALEHAASILNLPILIEGYPPPHDPRIEYMKVTPDPGVIEVNLQPAYSWREMVNNTTILYEEARNWLLRTDKFQVDGRHIGTGGGNHVVVGGATPADSPFLRRPDLLKSLLGYWLNHPSLSYLFSGLFMGPTSQAPRVDEGRPDAAYELELAFRQIPQKGEEHLPPWMVDRVLRHLLTDLTGNTHRAEFCIDKLYSPDSATGRLGLVEFRGFEMPPHAQMSLTQQLLLRALIMRFWDRPYEQPLTRWLTHLHDRFLLPHFVRQDFATVIEELNDAGFAFQKDWFITHFEFRFSIAGTVTYDGTTIELRQAIEPWLVLGEEAGAGGTARYVDSSLERLQVKVTGLNPQRHAVAVNQIELPLTPTGQPGEYVAGVRFRAWQPPSCLHPNIPVHAPLVFDLVDRNNARAIGGCTYHVSHLGGRGHERFPVNALEAETRRSERFYSIGHSPGPLALREVMPHPETPVTLDLRRF